MFIKRLLTMSFLTQLSIDQPSSPYLTDKDVRLGVMELQILGDPGSDCLQARVPLTVSLTLRLAPP